MQNCKLDNSQNAPPFMEVEVLLSYSQEPATGLQPEPDESSPQ